MTTDTNKTSNKEMCDTIREVMQKWDITRAEWIKRFGSDAGFSEWFSKQVGFSR